MSYLPLLPSQGHLHSNSPATGYAAECVRCVAQAAYHGVPIAGIPLIADQLDNVMKAVHRGFGLAISPKGGLKAGAIGAALHRLLEEPGFAAAAGKLQRRLRSRPRTPAQEAAGVPLYDGPNNQDTACISSICVEMKQSAGTRNRV